MPRWLHARLCHAFLVMFWCHRSQLLGGGNERFTSPSILPGVISIEKSPVLNLVLFILSKYPRMTFLGAHKAL